MVKTQWQDGECGPPPARTQARPVAEVEADGDVVLPGLKGK